MLKSNELIQIHAHDNVAVAITPLNKGDTVTLGDYHLTCQDQINTGHKIAIRSIEAGEDVIKYGFPIGHTTRKVEAGAHIHSHNVETNLSGTLDYTYTPELSPDPEMKSDEFLGFVRANGDVAIRNEIWIVNTVGCVNKTAEILARESNQLFAGKTDGIFHFTHPFGCSQLGDDHEMTQHVLANMVKHPNAAGVLVLGLGCENNNIPEFKKV